jgi:hypothetical protein
MESLATALSTFPFAASVISCVGKVVGSCGAVSIVVPIAVREVPYCIAAKTPLAGEAGGTVGTATVKGRVLTTEELDIGDPPDSEKKLAAKFKLDAAGGVEFFAVVAGDN